MASIQAVRNASSIREIYNFPTCEDAKNAASSLMSYQVPRYETETGYVTKYLYSCVDIYDDNGKYVTTAWGE